MGGGEETRRMTALLLVPPTRRLSGKLRLTGTFSLFTHIRKTGSHAGFQTQKKPGASRTRLFHARSPDQYNTTSTTRRFWARPSRFMLLATCTVSP